MVGVVSLVLQSQATKGPEASSRAVLPSQMAAEPALRLIGGKTVKLKVSIATQPLLSWPSTTKSPLLHATMLCVVAPMLHRYVVNPAVAVSVSHSPAQTVPVPLAVM